MVNDRTSRPRGTARGQGRDPGRLGKAGGSTDSRTTDSRSTGTGDRRRGRGRNIVRGRQVVTRQRWPWGLIAASVAVAAFATAVISYAVVKVNRANADKITSAEQIRGIETLDYANGQEHVSTSVDYAEAPPVGGAHDTLWAECTGTVYAVDIRNENAVHSLEHGATWITYDPERVDQQGIDTLSTLVEGTAGSMLSPRPGLEAPIIVQAWNNRLKVESSSDPRIKQFLDFLTFNPDTSPEPGASCDSPAFAANPLTNGGSGAPTGGTELPSAPTTDEGGAAATTSTTP